MNVRKLVFSGMSVFLLSLAPLNVIAGIEGSDHDFSQESWNPTGEICIVCHTPHFADTTVPSNQLWNHELTHAVYTVYTSPTLKSTPGQPEGTSKLCLSCHDGTVAIDNFGGRNSNTVFMSEDHRVGTDLNNDHPISLVYDSALAASKGNLHDPVIAPSALGGTIDDDLLRNGRVECVSCHDPHSDDNGDFLIKSNQGSALCLTCHNL